MDDTVIAATISGGVGILAAFGVQFLKQHSDKLVTRPIQTAEAFGEVFRGFNDLLKFHKEEIDNLQKQVEELMVENRQLRSEVRLLQRDNDELKYNLAQQSEVAQRQSEKMKGMEIELDRLHSVVRMISDHNGEGKDG